MDLRSLLTNAGYVVRTRTDGFTECLVAGHGEAWFGRGLDEATALEALFTQMMPSWLARSLVGMPVGPAEAAPAGVAAPAAGAGEPAAAAQIPGGVDAGAIPLLAAVSDEGEPSADVPASRGASPWARGDASERPEGDEAPWGDADEMGEGDLETLEALTDEIDESVALDFPLLAPELMRLQLLAWAADARDLQDRCPGSWAAKRAGGVIGRLVELGRGYWPGTVAALRWAAGPSEAAVHHGLGADVRDWFDVARRAEEALAARREGHDEYGWADAAALPPPPPAPRDELAAVEAIVADHFPPAETGGPRAPGRSSLHALTGAARRLRRLRGCVEPAAWGAAMGRLRHVAWLSSHAPLRAALDSAFCPPRSWYQLERGGGAPEVGAVAPPPADVSDAGLEEWLRKTGDRLDLAQLRVALADHRERVAALDLGLALAGAAFSGLRRRLRRLLQGPAERASGSTDASEPAAPAEPAATAEPSVVERARQRVAGGQALFVSNRADPVHSSRLEQAFDLAVDWCSVAQPRVVQSHAERIRGGRYDLVLLATGFMDHGAEHILRGAARDRGVRVVRAGKGRVQAVALSILRDCP